MRFRIMMLAAALTVTALAAYQKANSPETKVAMAPCCSGDPLPVCPPICAKGEKLP